MVSSVLALALLGTSGCGAGSDSGPVQSPVDGSESTTTSTDREVPASPEEDSELAGATSSTAPEQTDEEPGGESVTGPPWAPTELGSDGETVETWTVEIIDRRPHDPTAFTQGLEVHDGTLYESTGYHVTASSVRTVDIATGEVIESIEIDPPVFAEGLTITGDLIYQLTWTDEVAYVRELETLGVVGEFEYEGQGWGICHDGESLVMSDGTDQLVRRDPTTFDPIEAVLVHDRGQSVDLLNELECMDGYVLANVYRTDTIVVIEPTTGRVAATIDASVLTVDAIGASEDTRVLNGIARLDEDTVLLTGKEWPTMYRVRFVPA